MGNLRWRPSDAVGRYVFWTASQRSWWSDSRRKKIIREVVAERSLF